MQSREFEEFATSDFDVKAWINSALDGPRPDDVAIDVCTLPEKQYRSCG
jgi:hypothetical protein